MERIITVEQGNFEFQDITSSVLSTKQTLIKNKDVLAPTPKTPDLLYDQIKLFQKLIVKFIESANLNPDDNNTLILTNEESKEASLIYKYTIKRTSLDGYFNIRKNGETKKITYKLDFSTPSLIYNKRKIVNDITKIKDEIARFQRAVTAYVDGKANFYSFTN